MICVACNRDMHPFQEFVIGRGLVSKCAFEDCRSAVTPVGDEPEEGRAEPVPIAARPATKDEPLDILALASERLVFVRSKVADLRRYEIEEKRLEALLVAAELLDVAEAPGSRAGVAVGNGSFTTFVGH